MSWSTVYCAAISVVYYTYLYTREIGNWFRKRLIVYTHTHTNERNDKHNIAIILDIISLDSSVKECILYGMYTLPTCVKCYNNILYSDSPRMLASFSSPIIPCCSKFNFSEFKYILENYSSNYWDFFFITQEVSYVEKNFCFSNENLIFLQQYKCIHLIC